MKNEPHSVASALVLSATTTAALAESGRPTKSQSEVAYLTSAQMDSVRAGAITQVNGGGNTPGGNANGIPKTNPAGKEPAGQNK
jgi:hypothetical protein